MTAHAPVEVLTFGCRLNLVESEAIRRAATAAGQRDLVVVNSCAVTAEAVRQARQAIRRTARLRPGARIVATGCAVETDGAAFAGMADIAAIVPNGAKLRRETWGAPEIWGTADTAGALAGIAGHTRGFVAVQNGCDHRCTFCIIPFGRGASRSLGAAEVIGHVAALVRSGHREVVLTGVDLTSWGADLPETPRLGNLVGQILAEVPDLPRLRLSSLDVAEIDASLFDVIAGDRRFMPHLHLSLQAGNDLVLKRMKRRHSRAGAIRICGELRQARPEIVFGADLIAGFPTETEAMFEDSLSLIEACGLTHIHAFPYSLRPGTPAAKMPQVAPEAARERVARLRHAGHLALLRHLDAQIGKPIVVLAERGGRGRCEDFTAVRVPGSEPGTLLTGEAAGHDGEALILRRSTESR